MCNTELLQMTKDEEDAFMIEVRARVLAKTLLPSSELTCLRLTSGMVGLGDQQQQQQNISDAMHSRWLRFLRRKIPFEMCNKITQLRIELLHIESAWLRFQGQLTEMRGRKLSTVPELMYHGVRALDASAAAADICAFGFNPKHARQCMHGSGGIYCSPQLACALSYVKHPERSSMGKELKNFCFVCLVLPGKVGYNGQPNQPMAPDQNAWCTLSPPFQIYCVEAILPIALISY